MQRREREREDVNLGVLTRFGVHGETGDAFGDGWGRCGHRVRGRAVCDDGRIKCKWIWIWIAFGCVGCRSRLVFNITEVLFLSDENGNV